MGAFGHGGYNVFGGDRMIWPFTWKKQRDEARAASKDFHDAYKDCASAQAWVSVFLNNALTLLYCVAIALAIWKLRNHMDWKP